MPCTTFSTAQVADLLECERGLAYASGDLAALQAILDRLAASGLPGAKAARRAIGRAVCLMHEAVDALSDDVRSARQAMPGGYDEEAPF